MWKRIKERKIKLVSNNGDDIFRPLSPKERKQKDVYEDVFADKLSRGNEYHNIALVGIFGSGKSSILKSLKCLKEKNVIRVSLAKLECDEKNGVKDLSFVQLKILQQVINQINHKKIPLLGIEEYKEHPFYIYLLYVVSFLIFLYGSLTFFLDENIVKYLNNGEIFRNQYIKKSMTAFLLIFIVVLLLGVSLKKYHIK